MNMYHGRITVAAGLVGIAVLCGTGEWRSQAFAANAGNRGMTDISAQSQQKGIKAPRPGAPRTGAPRTVAPRTVAPRTVAPRTAAPRTVTPRTNVVRPAPHVVTPRPARPAVTGPAVVRPGVARVAPRTTVYRGRSVTYVRGPWTVRRGPYVRHFVAASILAPVIIGAATYYPYAYLPFEGPSCSGYTPDGCELRWQEVPTIDGFRDFQCVAFCPWR